MQGIVFDIKRFAVNDGPGIRTTVFFKGCPLKCYWCHNPEGIGRYSINTVKTVKLDGNTYSQPEVVGKVFKVNEVMKILRKDRVFMDESGGGVTFSGGEPTFQPDFLIGLLKACQKEGIHTAIDTNGFTPPAIMKEIIHFTNLFLFDLKHYDPKTHIESTGASNELILENLRFLVRNRKSIRIRIPVVPDFNFNNKDLSSILNLIQSYRGSIEQIDLLPYHTLAMNKYKRLGIKPTLKKNIPGLKKEDLKDAKELFEQGGFTVKIGG